MNLEAIRPEIEKASLYELWRLQSFIYKQLDDPIKQQKVRSLLKHGQNVAYFSREENRDIAAQVLEIHRSKVSVRNCHDQKIWLIPFYMLNIDASKVDLGGGKHRLDRNTLQVGNKVSFMRRDGAEAYGVVTKLNQKSASVKLACGAGWRVGYGLLSYVFEGEADKYADPRLIEGEVLHP